MICVFVDAVWLDGGPALLDLLIPVMVDFPDSSCGVKRKLGPNDLYQSHPIFLVFYMSI